VKTAAEIQRALLPQSEHKGAGFEVAAASLPCRAIGGDFFDYFDLPNGPFGFALADVAGKGPPAALLAAQLQGILAAHSYSAGTPAHTVTRVNEVLARRTIESRFATALYGQLSCDGSRLSYCNAGHNPPLLFGRRGVRRLEKGGLILGAFGEATFEEETLQLDPGDTLVVFSDGVTEALNAEGVEFGEERLQSCVTINRELGPQDLLNRILNTVREFSANTTQSDDLTVLVLRHSGT
jgi:sigma-B regulation protein RsbU (phosphoserine phosphatase)